MAAICAREARAAAGELKRFMKGALGPVRRLPARLGLVRNRLTACAGVKPDELLNVGLAALPVPLP